MYVGVMHTITNKKMWAEKLAGFDPTALPAGFENPISYVGAEADFAFCLWSVPSMEALMPMLDEVTEGAADNMYFQVDPNAVGTLGIPGQRIDLDTRATTKA